MAVEDYLDLRLHDLNLKQLASREPWTLMRTSGPELMLGPLIVPGETACWACLRHSLVENRWAEHAAWRNGQKQAPSPLTPEMLAAANALLEAHASELTGRILTLAHPEATPVWHTVRRRADCASCSEHGRPRLWPAIDPQLERLHSPVCGIASGLTLVSPESWLPLHIVAAHAVIPFDVKHPLSGQPPETCAGRGLTMATATRACLAEAAERYSMFPQGTEPEPEVMAHDHILNTRRPVPTDRVYRTDSTGCAAGPDEDTAFHNAVLEVIERDAAAIWWRTRAMRPRIRWDHFGSPFLQGAPELFAANGYEVWLLDLTSDWSVPVYAAVCATRDGEWLKFATACNVDPEWAAQSAVTELVQTLLSSSSPLRRDDVPFLLGEGEAVPSAPAHFRAASQAQQLGADLWSVVLTRPEVGVPVIRAIIPQLCSPTSPLDHERFGGRSGLNELPWP